MEKKEGEKEKNAENSVFFSLLNRDAVDDEKLARKLDYAGWKVSDEYQIVLVCPKRTEMSAKAAEVLRTTIMNIFPESRIVGGENAFVLIWNLSKCGSFKRERVRLLLEQTEADVSMSLWMEGIYNVWHLYRQAKSAQNMKTWFSGETDRIFDFYKAAADHILLSGDMEDMVYACHPDVRRLWLREQEEKDGLFATFSSYLKHERSVLNTSQDVYIHRNTLLYRIRKIKEFLESDLDDAYTRNYMQLSVMVLELYEMLRKKSALILKILLVKQRAKGYNRKKRVLYIGKTCVLRAKYSYKKFPEADYGGDNTTDCGAGRGVTGNCGPGPQ